MWCGIMVLGDSLPTVFGDCGREFPRSDDLSESLTSWIVRILLDGTWTELKSKKRQKDIIVSIYSKLENTS